MCSNNNLPLPTDQSAVSDGGDVCLLWGLPPCSGGPAGSTGRWASLSEVKHLFYYPLAKHRQKLQDTISVTVLVHLYIDNTYRLLHR